MTDPTEKLLTGEALEKAIRNCALKGVADCDNCPVSRALKDDCQCTFYLMRCTDVYITELKQKYATALREDLDRDMQIATDILNELYKECKQYNKSTEGVKWMAAKYGIKLDDSQE